MKNIPLFYLLSGRIRIGIAAQDVPLVEGFPVIVVDIAASHKIFDVGILQIAAGELRHVDSLQVAVFKVTVPEGDLFRKVDTGKIGSLEITGNDNGVSILRDALRNLFRQISGKMVAFL